MATKTTFQAPIMVGKAGKTGHVVLMQMGSFSATSAAQVELFTLPQGAIPLDVISFGGATGGTNPTVDIGSAADDDGFANELDADSDSSARAAGTLGALVTGGALASDTVVYGKVGASAATGGTTLVAITYILSPSAVRDTSAD